MVEKSKILLGKKIRNNKVVVVQSHYGRETEYHREYGRKNYITNPFNGKQEKYNGRPCNDGELRHHIYYNLNDINDGITFITHEEHTKIHRDIRLGITEPIPIHCRLNGVDYIYNQRLTNIEHEIEKVNEENNLNLTFNVCCTKEV